MKNNSNFIIKRQIYLLSIFLMLIFASLVTAQPRRMPINQPVAETYIPTVLIALDLNADNITALATGDGLYLYNADLLLLAHVQQGEYVRGISWKPDTTQIAMAIDNQLEIWNWDDATNTLTLDRSLQAEGIIQAVSWSLDGNRIVVSSVKRFDGYTEIGELNVWETTNWSHQILPPIYSADSTFILPIYSSGTQITHRSSLLIGQDYELRIKPFIMTALLLLV